MLITYHSIVKKSLNILAEAERKLIRIRESKKEQMRFICEWS